MGKTSISWTDATWNPVVGCTRLSPGCRDRRVHKTGLRPATGDAGKDSKRPLETQGTPGNERRRNTVRLTLWLKSLLKWPW